MECCCCQNGNRQGDDSNYNRKAACGCDSEQGELDFTLFSFIKEYWKPLLSLLMLLGGIVMKGLEVGVFSSGYVSLFWYIIAYLPVGLPVLKEGWERICEKDFFNEFTLMSIAAIGAFYVGDYPEGVSVMLFYTIGELFQGRAVSKARGRIEALLDVIPKTVTVVDGSELISKQPEEVSVGDVIEIKAGERVPLDGVMLGESATFNTAALTGESTPCTIRHGEEVLSGMLSSDKNIRIKVAKPYDESTLARILDMVQHATERKAPTELFITKFAHIYTPIVFGIALLVVLLPFIGSLVYPAFVFHFNEWLYRALVFLVISCPCALVISIPLGYFGGIGAASRHGILFKGGNYLDAIAKVNTVVFDKTGTLTKGVFDIQEIHSAGVLLKEFYSSCSPLVKVHPIDSELGGTSLLGSSSKRMKFTAATISGTLVPSISTLSERELVSLIASVENSTHPIAKAITVYARKKNIPFTLSEDVSEVTGYGLKARVEGREVLVGSTRLLAKYGVDYPVELDAITDTLVLCAVEREYVGFISLSDTLKDDAKEAVEALKGLNIENIQLLSGDKQHIVTNFAKKLGIPEAYGNLLPGGKVEHLNLLKQSGKQQVAFVGDGMNDAPVLALSDVGIAMGGLGSDMAIETADVIIQTDQPSKVATAICIGRYTRRIVWQNISLAMGIKVLVMLLGALGMATLWEAVFADVGVALLAVLNAMRIGNLLKR